MNITFTLYSENLFFFPGLFMVIQIHQLTAGDKLLDGLTAKMSMATISDHLNPENTVIRRELES